MRHSLTKQYRRKGDNYTIIVDTTCITMKNREMHKILIECGYKIIRTGKHNIYSNGIRKVPLSIGKDVSHEVTKKILKELKRESEAANADRTWLWDIRA